MPRHADSRLGAQAAASLHQRLLGWILVEMKLSRKRMEKSPRTGGTGSSGASLERTLTRALRWELGKDVNM